MQALKDRYEDQFRPQRKRRLSPEKTKQMDSEFAVRFVVPIDRMALLPLRGG